MRGYIATLALVAAATGCKIHEPNFTEDDAPEIDASTTDARIVDAEHCPASDLAFTLKNVAACDVPDSIGDFVLTGSVTIDTTDVRITDGGGTVTGLGHAVAQQIDAGQEVMVIAADDLTVETAATVTVTGTRPLVMVAFGSLIVRGTIDATGDRGIPGPGADLGCAIGAGVNGPIHVSSNTRPGGAGGSGGGYGSAAGNGGEVDPAPGTAMATPGGAAWQSDLMPILGGCSGGDGGSPNGGTAAPGGGGGGGLQLAGGVSVFVAAGAIVSVSGAGGTGATALETGGGAGGSGGSVLVQTVDLTIAGFITANGGAGGEGRRDTQNGLNGPDGDVDSEAPAVATGNAAGGNGGNGAAGATAATDGVPGLGTAGAVSGGGGGGAGIGRIHFDAQTTDLTGSLISPSAT